MKTHSLLILLVFALALVPFYYLNRWLQQVIRPRDAASRFFLFIIANFVLIIVYTVLLVGLIVRMFGR
jgi:hypothetical protein